MTAGAVTLTTPADGATGVTMQDSTPPDGEPVSGAVSDASGAGIAYKLVSLTGSDGVYFASDDSASAGLSRTLTVGADAAGQYSAFAFYTKSGTASVTVSADGKSVTNTVTTADPAEGYKIVIRDVFTTPGTAVTVSGKVTDAFGNPAKNVPVTVTIPSTDLGTLGAIANTTAGGIFSGTFTQCHVA